MTFGLWHPGDLPAPTGGFGATLNLFLATSSPFLLWKVCNLKDQEALAHIAESVYREHLHLAFRARASYLRPNCKCGAYITS
jgi:hypothetical protein